MATPKTKTKTKKVAPKAEKAKASPDNGAKKYHMASSPKSKVHRTFDEKGKRAAEALGDKLNVSNGRLQRWFREWSHAA